MSAATSVATQDGVTAKDHAALIAEHFRQYNEEFGRITRRAALNFLAEDWQSAQLDAVARIELYEQRVARCVASTASQLRSKRTEVALWVDIKRAYEIIVARRPDSDFYRTFFNSVTRDLFGTVGVNPEVEFCATSVGCLPRLLKPAACSTCHRDHKGRDANIVPLDKKQFDHKTTGWELKGAHAKIKCEACHADPHIAS